MMADASSSHSALFPGADPPLRLEIICDAAHQHQDDGSAHDQPDDDHCRRSAAADIAPASRHVARSAGS